MTPRVLRPEKPGALAPAGRPPRVRQAAAELLAARPVVEDTPRPDPAPGPPQA
ncbi:hypothetical protein [Streptomyces niveus]|uniref:hypothetical protein n=1 Tax=Streptomyces niveus TaxID=193462 RepID=UPI0036D3B268